MISQWDVAWADLDPVAGHEQAGHRPVIVVSTPLHLRMYPTLVTVMPMTTRGRPQLIHRVRIETPGRPVSWAITEQVRTISRSRLGNRAPLYRLTGEQIEDVGAVLRRMIGT